MAENKYPKEIVLKSRYSDVHSTLVNVYDNVYKLVTTGHFVRTMFDHDPSKITAVDPEGGPMLGIGDAVTDKLSINKIWHSKEHQGYLFELV